MRLLLKANKWITSIILLLKAKTWITSIILRDHQKQKATKGLRQRVADYQRFHHTFKFNSKAEHSNFSPTWMWREFLEKNLNRISEGWPGIRYFNESQLRFFEIHEGRPGIRYFNGSQLSFFEIHEGWPRIQTNSLRFFCICNEIFCMFGCVFSCVYVC